MEVRKLRQGQSPKTVLILYSPETSLLVGIETHLSAQPTKQPSLPTFTSDGQTQSSSAYPPWRKGEEPRS